MVNPKSSNFRTPDAHFWGGFFGPGGGEEKGFPAGVALDEPEDEEEEGVPAGVPFDERGFPVGV